MKSILAQNSNFMLFHILTFGCQMNMRDSQWLSQALARAGHSEAPLEQAQIALLNTCSVREKPERRVAAAIKRISRSCPHLRFIGVLGCVAQQLGEKLFEVDAKVALVAGGDNIGRAPAAIESLIKSGDRISLLDLESQYRERPPYACGAPGRSAFVNIMQGCDNFCSYCIVPFTRGRQKSRSMAAIIDECRQWLAEGIIEITLLGQNVNAWGMDLDYKYNRFADLLRQVSALPGLRRLRFVTPHPKDLDDATIACFGELPNLCPRLHLPLQAGSDNILKAMRRRHSAADYLALVEKLKAARPDVALATDLIVGFPGEMEEDFQKTLEMMTACQFTSSYSFCYSDRPGTRASTMPGKIAENVKLERLGRLQALQDELTSRWLAGRVGQNAEVLIERPSPRSEPNSWQGRDAFGACVNVELPTGRDHAGELVNVAITEAKKHSLAGAWQS